MRLSIRSLLQQETAITKEDISITSRLKAYVVFTKFRLSFLVVVSAAICFLIASKGGVDWEKFVWLIIGGFLVTGASNGYNQVIEKDLDKLMERTKLRPLPTGQISVYEGLLIATCMATLGLTILYFLMNPLSGILGAIALLSYTLIYTPLKRVTPFAVFVGAFPGAIPPLLGYVAATNQVDITAVLLFGMQFLWQFPHFWSIAWLMDEDYKRAGFKMLPGNQKNKQAAFQVLIYAFSLIPASFLPISFNVGAWPSAVIMVIASLLFAGQALKLYKECSDETARKLMFGSFIYLPVVQLAWLLDKFII